MGKMLKCSIKAGQVPQWTPEENEGLTFVLGRDGMDGRVGTHHKVEVGRLQEEMKGETVIRIYCTRIYFQLKREIFTILTKGDQFIGTFTEKSPNW